MHGPTLITTDHDASFCLFVFLRKKKGRKQRGRRRGVELRDAERLEGGLSAIIIRDTTSLQGNSFISKSE